MIVSLLTQSANVAHTEANILLSFSRLSERDLGKGLVGLEGPTAVTSLGPVLANRVSAKWHGLSIYFILGDIRVFLEGLPRFGGNPVSLMLLSPRILQLPMTPSLGRVDGS